MNSITAKAGELGLQLVQRKGYGKGDVDFKAQLTISLQKIPMSFSSPTITTPRI
jgi:hypothetical protein